MNEEIMNEIQPVRPKDQFTFSCRQCGACCRNIEGCVMVESLDAYCLARYLRAKGEPIEGIEDFLFRYCEPEPLTEEGFPIYMLKTKVPNGSCIFLTDGRCSVYPARTRTCRIYPLTVGPGERGRDFEYCLCLDRHQSHFTGSRVSVKDWLYQNFKREDKEYVKREYEIATELGKLMRAIDPTMRQGIVFKVLYYRYYNFDLDQPFQPQYLELFRQGRRELDEHSPTVTELALSILNRIFQDIDRDCRQCEFEALSLEEQLAELKRAEESRQAWRQYIASLKEMINPSAAQE